MPRQLRLVLLVITAACGNDVAHTDGPIEPAGPPVYYGGVQKIINENCVECHSASADRLAPFSLATYEDARLAAVEWPISFAVTNRTMPPYYAPDDGSCQTYHDTKWLSDAEIEQLVAWTSGERLAGDPAASIAPPAPRPDLARVDHTFDIGAKAGSYLPDTVKSDDYRCFVVDGIAAERFATGAHVRPGNPTVVHHVILYTLDTAAAEADVVARDQADPGNGYACDGGPTETGATFLVGWAPGQQATIFPAGTGIRIAGGRRMVIQMHYNVANGDGGTDRTTIDLMLENQVANEALMISVRGNVDLAPGQPDVVATGTRRLPTAVPAGRVWGGAMHMHQRGIAADVSVQRSSNSCLLDLQGWSFHWQHTYWYEAPVPIAGGDTLEINCHYDTSDDTTRVTWGEATTDEMCVAYMYISR